MKVRRGANHALLAEGVDAAISSWTAEERSRVSGQELTGEETREISAWSISKEFKPAKEGAMSKSRGVPGPGPEGRLS